ncbi:MAG: hypothetical protein ACI4FZ_01980 [Lachnospiraceae bacterium]
MKKFAKKLFVFVIIIAIVIMSVNFVYVKQYQRDSDYRNKFASIPDTLQICDFGSSHALYGYNYEDISDNYSCFNFGMVSQFLSYDYRLFQYYGEHIDDGTVVFITVSYSSLFGNKETSYDSFASKNKRYYSILPKSLIKEYDFVTDMLINYVPALGVDTGVLIKTLLGRSNDVVWQRVATDIDVGKNAEDAFYGHIVNGKYDEEGNRIKNQEEIDALYALVKGCQEKGAIPVLITTPYLQEYTDEVKENAGDFYNEFYSIIDQVVEDTGVEYYDYAFDERFSNNYSWFMDSDHLNKEGARNFVDILMREIVYEKGYY